MNVYIFSAFNLSFVPRTNAIKLIHLIYILILKLNCCFCSSMKNINVLINAIIQFCMFNLNFGLQC